MPNKEYDAREISITVDGEQIADVDSFGYDQSKAHELERTLDGGSVWVKGTGEFTGSFAIKATSDNVPMLEDLFQDGSVFDVTISYAEREPRSESTFIDCVLTDFGPSDYELDGVPTVEGSWEAAEVTHS